MKLTNLIQQRETITELIQVYYLKKSESEQQIKDYVYSLALSVVNRMLARYDLTIEDIKYSKNIGRVQMCRHEINFMLFDIFGGKDEKRFTQNDFMRLILTEIGGITGVHHATVLNSIKVINNYRDTDGYFKIVFNRRFREVKRLPEIVEYLKLKSC